MGTTKTENFTDKQNEIASLTKALANPARVAIMEYLMSVDTCICSDIVNELPLAQATVSQHLKELRNGGLINGTIKGNAICYAIDEQSIDQLVTYFSAVKTKLKNKIS